MAGDIAKVGLFHLPVGCPRVINGERPTEQYVQKWLRENKTSSSVFKKTSYGTYAGIATAALGIVSSVFGIFKDNTFAKIVGGICTLAGAVTTFIGKCFGYDFNLVDSINNRILFNPPTKFVTDPEKEGIPHEEVHIDVPADEVNEAVQLHGYFLPAPEKTDKTILYLHGRANNIGDNLLDVKEIQKHVPVNVLMVDYRGFGKSTGSPTRDGVLKDAEAMYDYLVEYLKKKGLSTDSISFFGHSLGGAVAIELAAKFADENKHIKSVIVQSSFTSIHDVAKEWAFMVPNAVVNALVRDQFNSEKIVDKIEAPILFIHGMGDKVISVDQAKRLFEKAKGPKGIFIIPGCNHSDFREHLESAPKCVETINALAA